MLEKFPGFDTQNRDEVANVLASKFDVRYYDAKNFHLRINWAELKSSIISSASYRGDRSEVTYGAIPFVRYYAMIGGSGGLAFHVEGRTFELDRKSRHVCIPANTTYTVKSSGDHTMLTLRMDIDDLKALSRRLLDLEIDDALCALDRTTALDRGATSWMHSVRQFADDLHLLGPDGPSDFKQCFERALLAQFVLWSTNAIDRSLNESGSPSRTQFKRMEDYIRANWSRPIEVNELAAEFEMSARTIFRLFAQELNQTPRQYIRHVRLENARRMLLSASGDASVISIAFECGFSSLGHFARDYYSCFHELPSHTLRKRRGTS